MSPGLEGGYISLGNKVFSLFLAFNFCTGIHCLVQQGGDCLRLSSLSPRPAWHHQHRRRPPRPRPPSLLLLLPQAEETEEEEVDANQQPAGRL